jgi:hypothetical protein
MAQSLELLTVDVQLVTADVKELTKNQAATMAAIAHIAAV